MSYELINEGEYRADTNRTYRYTLENLDDYGFEVNWNEDGRILSANISTAPEFRPDIVIFGREFYILIRVNFTIIYGIFQ